MYPIHNSWGEDNSIWVKLFNSWMYLTWWSWHIMLKTPAPVQYSTLYLPCSWQSKLSLKTGDKHNTIFPTNACTNSQHGIKHKYSLHLHTNCSYGQYVCASRHSTKVNTNPFLITQHLHFHDIIQSQILSQTLLQRKTKQINTFIFLLAILFFTRTISRELQVG